MAECLHYLKGDNDHDMWICVLTVLLSHLLIYNTVSTIDQRAIENLKFVYYTMQFVYNDRGHRAEYIGHALHSLLKFLDREPWGGRRIIVKACI